MNEKRANEKRKKRENSLSREIIQNGARAFVTHLHIYIYTYI